MKTIFDKNHVLFFGKKISKNNNLNKSYINQKYSKNLLNLNQIDSKIITIKERSKSVNLIRSSSIIFYNEKENKKGIKNLISEKEKNKKNKDFSISSNISSDSTYNELIQENKQFDKKNTQQKRINYIPNERIKLIKKDNGLYAIKKYLFLKKNPERNENKENINLNSNQSNNKNLRIKIINTSPINNNNTINEIFLKNKNNNLTNKINNKEKINKVDNGKVYYASYFSSKSQRENNIFRRNNNFKSCNSSNSPLNTYHKNILFQKLNSSNNFFKKSNNVSLICNINYNNNIPYKIESYFNKKNSILEKIENASTNNNILYNSTFIKKKISNNVNNNIQNKIENIIIELEDLIVLEEKLFYILTSLKNKKPQYKYCIEWWNFYVYTSFGGKFELFFKKNENKMNFDIAHEATNLELFSIILIYNVLRNFNLNQCNLFLLENLINEVHQNFLIVCDYILFMIKEYFPKDNFWFCKIKEIISSKLSNIINLNEHIILLKKGNCTINLLIETILNQFENEKQEKIINSNLNFYFNKISKININNLNIFFKKIINEDSNFKEGILDFNRGNNSNLKNPYLNKKLFNDKKFTLILELDDILINLKYDDLGRGILKFRPNLFLFLNEIKKIFEIIIFTIGIKEYVEPIINIIEKDKKYFDKILYREYLTLINDDFVKDLSKLGRDLSKVIIIDSLPQSFKLQKENAILIKTFDGENKNDCKLKELIPILKKVTSNHINDVRIELMKMKKEIISKISTDLEN